MKLKILSDLHTEFGNITEISTLFSNDDVDIFVCAGDLTSSKKLINILTEIDNLVNVPVIFVAGNHEYYNATKEYIDRKLREHQFKHIIVLNEDTYIHEDIVFLGSTGWFTEPIKMAHITGIRDFSAIYDINTDGNYHKWGRRSKLFFRENLDLHKDKKVICVSHHLPSFRCISERYRGDYLNNTFANRWDDVIMKFNPLMWICGHTHDSIDMMLFDTRVICNPYGYRNVRVNPKFDKNLIIEV